MKTIRKLNDISCRNTKFSFFIFRICSSWISYYTNEITSSNLTMSFFKGFLTFMIFFVDIYLDFSIVSSYIIKNQSSTTFSYTMNSSCDLNDFVEKFSFFCDVFIFFDKFRKTYSYLEFMRERIFTLFYFLGKKSFTIFEIFSRV